MKILKLRLLMKMTAFKLSLLLECVVMIFIYAMMLFYMEAYTTSVTSAIYWLILFPIYVFYMIYGS